MYVRLAFAVAAHLEPEILIVDEVLAVGDAEFQKKCLGKMDEVARATGERCCSSATTWVYWRACVQRQSGSKEVQYKTGEAVKILLLNIWLVELQIYIKLYN